MTSVCLYFKVHQPHRLVHYEAQDTTSIREYTDRAAEQQAINRAADLCYLPANEILYRAICQQEGKFCISFSISGTTIELLEAYRPDVIASFQKLAGTGCVEILAETHYHSLSFLHSRKEFQRQVEKHSNLIKTYFGLEPAVFRNTALIYNNELARFVAGMGFKGILCEGVERILRGRTANQVYAVPDNGDFGLLLRNNALSDDIAFRFGDPQWSEHPLTADKFASWLHQYPSDTEVVNIFLDYETIGIHKHLESGIFQFLEALPAAVISDARFLFATPSEALHTYYPRDVYNVPQTISWEDRSDTNCVWSSNTSQNNSLKKIYAIESMVLASSSRQALETWGQLQSAEHFYYMGKQGNEAGPGLASNPFNNAEDAFRNYNNILVDFEISLIKNSIFEARKSHRADLPAYNLY